jgi:hypothetical protein
VSPARPPLLTVIDDGGISFRYRRSAALWPEAESPGYYLLKMSSLLCQGDLWAHLVATVGERLMVVVSADDLRREDAQIAQALSWEKCAEDTLTVLHDDPICRQLCQAASVVVTFGSEGALWVRGGSGGARLLFSPGEQEGDHARTINGTVYGFGTCVITGIAHELVTQHARAESSPSGLFADPVALERGIATGLRARRLLLELGHGRVGGDKPGFPVKAIADALTKPGGGYIATDVPPSARRSSDGSWTILRQAEIHGSPDTPLIDLACLTARFGPSAVSNVPALRLGSVLTVDRGEIESLRTLEMLIRAYEAQAVQKKPLSLGIFGPPGAGKSFAVKAMAKAVLGDRAPFLEFNLSQFNGPDDLIGAFHRVRDAVLQGTTPVAFWDEFDSQRYKWLQYLLAPMQDGAFQEGQITHPIGKCVFVFAGGTSHTFARFGPVLPENPTADQQAAYQREEHEFTLAKGPDFLSRLHGHLDVLEPNQRKPLTGTTSRDRHRPPGDGEAPPDITWPIRRAPPARHRGGRAARADAGTRRVQESPRHRRAGGSNPRAAPEEREGPARPPGR